MMQKQDVSTYFYLEPYVYVSVKGQSAIIYNTLSHSIIEIISNTVIIELLNKLINKNNLYVVELTEKDLNNEIISDFIGKAREFFIGDLLDVSISDKKPIQFIPVIKFKRDMNDTIDDARIMHDLTELTLFLNSSSNSIKKQNQQFPFCSSNFTCSNELDFNVISDLLPIVKSNLEQINISGTDIFHYSRFNDLIDIIKEIPNISFLINYQNPSINRKNIEILKHINARIKISVSLPIKQAVLLNLIQLLQQKDILYSFDFKVEKEEDVEIYQEILTKYNIESYSFLPFYNEENLNLFEEAVYLSKEDIIEAKPTQKDIFARQAINQLNYGKLFVLPDNSIYGNLNVSKLGNLSEDSIYEMVEAAYSCNKSWQRLRKNVSPCKKCIYNLLCPPLSNYEYAIGQNNLCHIKNV